MKLVLREDIENLGKRGEVVAVAKGYARNYLLPRELAFAATEENIGKVEQERKLVHAIELKEKEDAEVFSKKFKDVSITIIKKVAENQVLYGSVSQSDIAEKLMEEATRGGYIAEGFDEIVAAYEVKFGLDQQKVLVDPDRGSQRGSQNQVGDPGQGVAADPVPIPRGPNYPRLSRCVIAPPDVLNSNPNRLDR